jgi:hypothetical protein
MLPVITTVLVLCCAGYGWCIQQQVNIAAPLIIQTIGKFISYRRVSVAGTYGKGIGKVGFACISVMNSTQTLMIDLVPGQGSSITACVSDIAACS